MTLFSVFTGTSSSPKSPCSDEGLEALRDAVSTIGWDGFPDPEKLKALISRLQAQTLPPASSTAHPSGSSSGLSAGGGPSTTPGGAPSGKCHKPLRNTLGSLATYFDEKGGPVAQQKRLLSFGGTGSFGMQMAVYSASVARFDATPQLTYAVSSPGHATKYNELVLPTSCVQMDVRGSVAVSQEARGTEDPGKTC